MMTQTRKRNPGRASQQCKTGLEDLLSPRLFKALCDPNRLKILSRLANCCAPSSVSDISECCPVNISVVSRHLAMLREAGILEAEKRGKHVYYTVRARELVQTLRSLADAIETCCVPGAGRGDRPSEPKGAEK